MEAQELQISRPGDLEKSCGDLSREAALMRDIINVTGDIQNDREMQTRGVEVAGAVGSFLVGTATGGIGLAAAGLMAKTVMNNDAENAEAVQDIAKQRRSFMLGVFNAKGCYGPMDHIFEAAPLTETLNNIEPAAGGASATNMAESQRFNN